MVKVSKKKKKNDKPVAGKKQEPHSSETTTPVVVSAADAGNPEDAMSRCVALCQEQCWREAVLLCRRMCDRARRDGKTELADSLGGALAKIEASLRRQMAAALGQAVKDLLQKEYLLDVGK